MLFDERPTFRGFPPEAFDAFGVQETAPRRHAIIDAFHPGLEILAGRLKRYLNARADVDFHSHLPRLDWPRGYEPFCTWLALSDEEHGYQAGPQLNMGIHADHIAVRLGWDTSADAFGRFEFFCLRGHAGAELAEIAAMHGFTFRVYATAPWPEGSRCVFEAADPRGSFAIVERRGVWWELGKRYDRQAHADLIGSPELADAVESDFEALLPAFQRVRGPYEP